MRKLVFVLGCETHEAVFLIFKMFNAAKEFWGKISH